MRPGRLARSASVIAIGGAADGRSAANTTAQTM
jgi:hypothetical protein